MARSDQLRHDDHITDADGFGRDGVLQAVHIAEMIQHGRMRHVDHLTDPARTDQRGIIAPKLQACRNDQRFDLVAM